MTIEHLAVEDIHIANILWNNVCQEENFLYKTLGYEEFKLKFFQSSSKYKIITIGCFEEGSIKGFVSGVYEYGKNTAYVTSVVVDIIYRNQGIGNKLIIQLEEELKKLSNLINRFDIVFFNPIHLEWIIPGSISADHPNAPGVDKSTDAYEFFKNRGYIEFAVQNSYYRDITLYEFSDKTIMKLEELYKKNIKIVYFNKKEHLGFEELFVDLNSESWRNEILGVVNSPTDNSKILVVDIDKEINGFTGPLRVQESGRGYFCGIGVHSSCRGMGVGGVLFSRLCKGLKEQGAKYMSLFTGENNPARKIYEEEGFKVVRSWSDMRKKVM